MYQEQPLTMLKNLKSLQSVKEIRRGSEILIFSVKNNGQKELEDIYLTIQETFQKANIQTPFMVIPDNIVVLRYQTMSISKEIFTKLIDILAWPFRLIHGIIRRVK